MAVTVAVAVTVVAVAEAAVAVAEAVERQRQWQAVPVPSAGSSSSRQGQFGALPPFLVWSFLVPPRAWWQVRLPPALQGDRHRRERWHFLAQAAPEQAAGSRADPHRGQVQVPMGSVAWSSPTSALPASAPLLPTAELSASCLQPHELL